MSCVSAGSGAPCHMPHASPGQTGFRISPPGRPSVHALHTTANPTPDPWYVLLLVDVIQLPIRPTSFGQVLQSRQLDDWGVCLCRTVLVNTCPVRCPSMVGIELWNIWLNAWLAVVFIGPRAWHKFLTTGTWFARPSHPPSDSNLLPTRTRKNDTNPICGLSRNKFSR